MPFQFWPYTNFQNLNLDWILKKVKEAVDTATEASEDIDEALTTARQANTKADNAVSDASGALDLANNAYTTAHEAAGDASTALDNSVVAIERADTANTTATTAITTATSANSTANTANSTANNALSTAQQAVSIANAASKETQIIMLGTASSFMDVSGNTLTRAQILTRLANGENLYFVKADTGAVYDLIEYSSNQFSIYHVNRNTTNATSIHIITVPSSGTIGSNTYPFPSGGGEGGLFIITGTLAGTSGNYYYTLNKTAAQIGTAMGDGLLPCVVIDADTGGSSNTDLHYYILSEYQDDGEDIYITFSKVVGSYSNRYVYVLSYVESEHKAYASSDSVTNTVKYSSQSLTDPQKAQARTNIGASAETVRETVSGATATIDAEVDTLYLCGTMTALTIDTFPPTGIFSVVFTSGSTATTLTVPNTLIMPDGFTVEANKRYEINVLDGYVVAAEWSVTP